MKHPDADGLYVEVHYFRTVSALNLRYMSE